MSVFAFFSSVSPLSLNHSLGVFSSRHLHRSVPLDICEQIIFSGNWVQNCCPHLWESFHSSEESCVNFIIITAVRPDACDIRKIAFDVPIFQCTGPDQTGQGPTRHNRVFEANPGPSPRPAGGNSQGDYSRDDWSYC